MLAKPLIVYGAGYLGRQYLHHLVCYYGDQTVVGFADDVRPAGELVAHGLKTLGSLDDALNSVATSPKSCRLVFAIGYSDMRARARALARAQTLGYEFFTIIHPKAIVEPNALIGAGSVILGGAILDQGVKLGIACFADIGVRLGADTSIGDNCYLSSGTSTGSRVVLGDNCFVGMDCTITTDVHVGSDVFINAKTLVAAGVSNGTKLVELHKTRILPNA